MKALFWFVLTAAGEISGCFAFWAWLRLGKSPLRLLPGLFALGSFAWALTRVETVSPGRAFAA
jgi:small multidrug resistance family-3 protein